MKLIKHALSIIILVVQPAILFSQTPIAILDFEAYGVSSPEVNALTNRLRNELHNTGFYRVFERGQMEEILKEQGFQQTGGCTSDECLVEVGRLIGVQQMVGGSISKVGDVFSVSVRIINVTTGELVKTTDYDHDGAIGDLLKTGMKNVALVLSGKTPIQYTAEPVKPKPEVSKKQTIVREPQVSTKPDLTKMKYYESKRKSPGTAVLLDILVPSLGHLYAGHWVRGLLFNFAIGLSAGYAVKNGTVEKDVIKIDERGVEYYTGTTLELTDEYYMGMGLATIFWIWELADASRIVKNDNKELYNTLFSENRLDYELKFIPSSKGAKIILSYNF